ncbi:hypothetical protein [Anaerovibrio sp.]|nr:hypothetical protein [Anaerovibrio sp.]
MGIENSGINDVMKAIETAMAGNVIRLAFIFVVMVFPLLIVY